MTAHEVLTLIIASLGVLILLIGVIVKLIIAITDTKK